MLYSIKQFLIYIFFSKKINNTNSQFLQLFNNEILKKKTPLNFEIKINSLREYYLSKKFLINEEDYGAGSKTFNQKGEINTSKLLKKVSITKKYGQVLYNLIRVYKVKHTLELGTSLGVSGAYLSNSVVTTIEGNRDLTEYTSKSLIKNGFSNITVINSKFDDILEKQLATNNFELIFVDGNHQEKPTLDYFKAILKYKNNNTVVVFDDINWSVGMNNAWNKIKGHKEVKLSIDLFKFGIVFFNEDIKTKQNLVVWY